MLSRRLGLGGEPPATLAVLSAELGVSRERIRQIEASILRRCLFEPQRHYWLEALYSSAAELLAGEDIILEPFDPQRARRVIARPTPSEAHTSVIVTPVDRAKPDMPPSDVPQETVDRLRDTINAIFAASGDDISDSILADLLVGRTHTVIVALVEHYNLRFAHGAFAGIDRKRLKALVRDARRAIRHPTAPTAYDQDAPSSAADEPELEEVALLVAEIRACVGHHLTATTCAHILHGSQGPKVDALVATYRPPHFGRLHHLGIRRVLELVKSAQTRFAVAARE